jgi:orotate phosphoribosyltransferase-like protein
LVKYTQQLVDRIHLMRDAFTRKEIAKEMNVDVRIVNYILGKRKPSIEVAYKKVEEATGELQSIWSRIKNFRFTSKLK